MAFARARSFNNGVRWTGVYVDAEGRKRSAGSFTSKREAERAAHRQEQLVLAGAWHDHPRGAITFAEYVEPTGCRPSTSRPPPWPPTSRTWTSTSSRSSAGGRSARSRRLWSRTGSPTQRPTACRRGRSGSTTPCCTRSSNAPSATGSSSSTPASTPSCPRSSAKKSRTLTPAEYDALLTALPDRHRLMVETAIETGLRWGELIALKPRHIDFGRRQLTVEETIVEVSKKHSPTGERYLSKPYPKDNEPRTLGVRQDWLDHVAAHISTKQASAATTCCSPPAPGPRISRNTFRTRVWLPAVTASGIDFDVRIHDLRHAHASWLLAGGSDLKSVMDRMGHAQIHTTQKYLHTLPDADQKNLDALDRMTRPQPDHSPR